MSTLSLRKIKHDSSAVDNITLDSSGNLTIAGTIAQSKAMTTQYDGIGIRMGSSTANTNRGATFLQHTFVDAGSNQGNYVYNHSLRQNDGTYIANVYTADYSAGVHSWYHPNGGLSGNPVMQIDASGRVAMPYQPAFLVHADSGQGTISAGSKVGWTPNPRFIRGSTFDGANDRYTAPISGVYWMHVVFHINSTTATARPSFRVNGSDYSNNADAIQTVMSITGSECTLVLACHLQLSAGDYVEVFARTGNGSLSFYSGHTWWSGHLVG